MKAAIVGSGPAAIGVLRALSEWCPDADVTVFDIGRDATGPLETVDPPSSWSEEYYRRLYAHLRRIYGRSIPPPKTRFGVGVPHSEAGRNHRVSVSNMRGGLSNFWGGSMLPFTDRELHHWPISQRDLAPYYRRIAELVGISGRKDELNEYFGDDYTNRPPIKPTATIEGLGRSINSEVVEEDYRVVAGVARLALETRPHSPNRCIYSGECAIGCSANAVWSAAAELRRFQEAGVVGSYQVAQVLSVDPGRRILRVRIGGAERTTSAFDRVYLCAGCISSTEIVMRSLEVTSGLLMADNTKFTFPILSLATGNNTTGEHSLFAMTNLVIGCVPQNDGEPFIPVQVYPTSRHLWRYYLPVGLWGMFEGIGRSLLRRVMWARIFLPSGESQRYWVELSKSGSPGITIAHEGAPAAVLKPVMDVLRRAVNRNGYYLPPLPLLREGTGYHYAGTLPYGRGLIAVDPIGALAPGVYVCDSAVFPDGPAISPTFTIMANACRSAHLSLDS